MEALYLQLSAVKDLTFWQDFFLKFYRAFIMENRWQQYIKGVGTTLAATALALLLGCPAGADRGDDPHCHDQQRPDTVIRCLVLSMP